MGVTWADAGVFPIAAPLTPALSPTGRGGQNGTDVAELPPLPVVNAVLLSVLADLRRLRSNMEQGTFSVAHLHGHHHTPSRVRALA